MSDEIFQRVIVQYAAPLARVAAGYASDTDQQKDLLQEIFFALWRALPSYRGESKELTFVLSVAHNRGMTFSARARKTAFTEIPESTPDPRSRPDADVERRERSARLYYAIRTLPTLQRQAMMLHLEGLSAKEIAVLQTTTENNVNVRLNRGRGALRARLGELRGGA